MESCHVNIQSIFGARLLTTDLTRVGKEGCKVHRFDMIPCIASRLVGEVRTFQANMLARLGVISNILIELGRVGGARITPTTATTT